MLRKLNVLALAAGLALATGPPAIAQAGPQGMPPQGMPMGSMKTTKDLDDQKRARADEDSDRALKQAPSQAQAPDRVTPTYRDTPEDRIMREKTDDGAHDRIDTQRQQ